ncbi:MAG: helix-turn-helix transcriptional regulator [Sediminibacterium sp.]|nr:helix-turn-helix transcriptional regulator [Sediminibacterium sp.]
MNENKYRNAYLYKAYFTDFYKKQKSKVREKILMKNINLIPLEHLINEEYGQKGTSKRDKFEKGFETFKLGAMIQQARLDKGLTQQQLAEICGTNKGYISKIENNLKEVRISTLQKIVEIGLGGKLDLSIRL